MAINRATIKVIGYLNDIKSFNWGTVLSVSVANSVKNKETGEWETASRDYYDVVLGDGVSADALTKDSVIEVEGSFKVGKTYAKRDGSTGIELKIRATSVKPANDPWPATAQRGEAAAREVLGATPLENAPF